MKNEKICNLVKLIYDDNDYYYRVTGMGIVKAFDTLVEAENYISSKGYRYRYSERNILFE